MAVYAKQGDSIVLMFSVAEAEAMRDLASRGAFEFREDEELAGPANPARAAARDRALRTIKTACEKGSRSGARIE